MTKKQTETGGKQDLMTKEAVANYWQVSIRTLDGLVANGVLPAIRLGHRTVRFRREAVDAALAKLEAGGQ